MNAILPKRPASQIHLDLKIGQTVELDGELYTVQERTEDGCTVLMHVSANRQLVISNEDICRKLASKAFRQLKTSKLLANWQASHLDRPFDSWPEDVKQPTRRKYWYVKGFADSGLKTRSRKVLRPLIAEIAEANKDANPPSVRQVQRWLQQWFDIGQPDLRDIRVLVPGYYRCGKKRNPLFADEVEDLMMDVINTRFMKPEGRFVTAEAIWVDLVAAVTELQKELDKDPGAFPVPDRCKDKEGKLRIPSTRTINRVLNSFDLGDVTKAHKGRYARYRKFVPVLRGPRPTRPLERVEIDHTQLDIILKDEKTGLAMYRPWLTLVVDCYTRCILGFYVSFNAPSARSTSKAAYQAIMPKTWLQDEYPDVINDWPCFGKWELVVSDNGSDFISADFTDKMHALCINVQQCPVMMPNFKGMVERALGTLLRKVCHWVAGTTFSNIQDKEFYPSEDYACCTLTELRHIITKWIVDDYHISYHRGLKGFPLDKWNEAVKANPVRLPACAEDVEGLLYGLTTANLTREGVKMLRGLTYNSRSEAIQRMLGAANRPNNLRVRYDFDDLDKVEIQDWREDENGQLPWWPLQSQMGEYTVALSERAHNFLRDEEIKTRKAGEKAKLSRLIEARRNAVRTIFELEERTLKSKKKKDRRPLPVRLEAIFGKTNRAELVREKGQAFVDKMDAIYNPTLTEKVEAKYRRSEEKKKQKQAEEQLVDAEDEDDIEDDTNVRSSVTVEAI